MPDLQEPSPPQPAARSRAEVLNAAHEDIRKCFVWFAAVFLCHVVINGLTMGHYSRLDGSTFYVYSTVMLFLLLAVVITYILLAASTVRTAGLLGKAAAPYVAYFIGLPFAVVGLAMAGQIPLGFFIQNGIMGSPIAVYLVLANQLEAEIQEETRLA